ncbi:MAG: ankyrin repeat domain-containing protein [Tatlockia sp.]|nr:ankyrin repeat domain-containing protein [Tatlockia sp.]
MRLNPAYKAIVILNQKSSISYKPIFIVNKNIKYCVIDLLKNDSSLQIAGKDYQATKCPHISIYEFYKPSEANGLSVFHYTWYGVRKENGINVSVVLHVYFDSVGRYRNCQLKNQDTLEIIKPISTAEEKTIQQHAQARSSEFFETILHFITQNFKSTKASVDDYLIKLDSLSEHLPAQFAKYKHTAKLCKDAMKQVDMWSFSHSDPRAALLDDLVNLFEENIAIESKQNNNRFYTPSKKQIQQKKEQPQIEIKSIQSKSFSTPEDKQFLKEKIQQLDDEINSNASNDKILESEQTLVALKLLGEKFRLLTHLRSESTIENKLIAVLQQINHLHVKTEKLFEKYALASNLEAIKSLRPYISWFNPMLFHQILNVGKVEICQYIVQSFDECIFYLNFCAFGSLASLTQAQTFLYWVYCAHEDPALLKMLLENGANPNFYGVTRKSEQGILTLAIHHQRENFIKILLENGAEPNPESGQVSVKKLQFSPINSQSFSKAIRKSKNNKPDFESITDSSPLQLAINSRNKNIIALLLQHGASVNKKDLENVSAIGHETCAKHYHPDLEIIKMLVDKGADINEFHGLTTDSPTPLAFACQRNDLSIIKGLINLGANPNQQIQCKALLDDKPFFLSITPFLKAAMRNNQDIVHYLLEQTQQPVSFLTAAMTVAFMFKNGARSLGLSDNCIRWINPTDPLFDPLCLAIMDKFDENTVNANVLTAYAQGKKDYSAGQYDQALHSFYLCLMFCLPELRANVSYSMGLCYKKLEKIEMAKLFFEACIMDKPTPTIKELVQKHLNELEEQNTSGLRLTI